MTNAWSLLYDEMGYSKKTLKDKILKMEDSSIEDSVEEQQTTKNTSEIQIEYAPSEAYFESDSSKDEIKNDDMPPWGHSDMEALGNQIDLNLESTVRNGFWKYEEDLTMKEIRDYLSGTYKSHYTSQESKTQTLDLIEGIGDAEPFCRSNAIKYLSRFGKKNGKSKLDILKAIHYCILLYHFSGLHKQPTGNYETF